MNSNLLYRKPSEISGTRPIENPTDSKVVLGEKFMLGLWEEVMSIGR